MLRAAPAVLFALFACGVPERPARPDFSRAATAPCPPDTVRGIDVSSYQGTIDWAKVSASGVKFAISKATEGLTVVDGEIASNWPQMKANGVLRGAYHFFHPQDDGAQQADAFLAAVGPIGAQGDLWPVLDWEVTDGKTDATSVAEAAKFIAEIKARTGLLTIIYTYPSFWTSLGAPAQFAQQPLWLASYTGSTATCPAPIAPWSSWSIWQWKGDDNSGSVEGVSGEDQNLFNGSLTALQAFATPPAAQVSGNAALTLVGWPDQHLEVFGRSPAGALLHAVSSAAGWGAPAALAQGAQCGSAAAFWGAPRSYPEVFSALADGSSGDIFYSGGSWGGFEDFGATGLSRFSTAVGNDGATHVFALGADGALWTNAWSGSAFAGWTSLGQNLVTGAGAITWGNGTVEVFATDAAGAVWHSWLLASATGWSGWVQLAGAAIASRPVPVRWPDGHAEVFARGADGRLYHAEFSEQTGWPSLSVVADDAIAGEPSAIVAAAGPEVFARDPSGRVLHLARSGAGYTSFAQIGDATVSSDPFGWARADGSVEVFAIDAQGTLESALRSAGAWGSWSAIGGGFDPCAPVPVEPGDAGTPASDAGQDEPDAGNAADAGPPANEDAGTPSGASDAGLFAPARSAGCSGTPPGALALLGLFFARRRRAR